MIATANDIAKQFTGVARPLLDLLEEEGVSDLLVNGLQAVYVERHGRLELRPNPFIEVGQLVDFIERLVVPIGRRIDAAQPYLDGRLSDGSRFHVILPPIASHGPYISIRKPKTGATLTLESFGPPEIAAWLKQQVKLRKNLIISGGTGAGKTSLLRCLLEWISEDERIAVIEESGEIRSPHPHTVTLEARPPTPDGKGEVTLQALIRNALRMRPDRIIVGECRGAEAYDMLQAMNSGHPGSFTTLHANHARGALRRLESLVLLTGFDLPVRVIREWISTSVQAVVQLERTGDGRVVREILGVGGLEGDIYRILPIYPPTSGNSPRAVLLP